LLKDKLGAHYGSFALAASGKEEEINLENELMRVVFSTKGGRVKRVELKKYTRYHKTDTTQLVYLFGNANDRFEYLLPVANAEGGYVSTSELYFQAEKTANSIVFRASAGDGKYFEQKYSLKPSEYNIAYDLNFVGLENILDKTKEEILLKWKTTPAAFEKNASYESTMTTVYYREAEKSPTYCSCTSADEANVKKPLWWVSHKQQFFNLSLVANTHFNNGKIGVGAMQKTPETTYLKELVSDLTIPYKHEANYSFPMKFYIGPNDYGILKAQNIGLEQIIPFGWSIFGTVNRWLVRPLFDMLMMLIPSYGLVILVLTLLVKLLLFPLQKKMSVSTTKMALLKPEIEELRKQFGSDPQRMQVEQMKLYRETGVSPFEGCLPSLAQLPVWLALYRFFPASIDFRHQGFLWAEDLSSYDSVWDFGTNIPLYGDHVSLFTLLWVVSMLAFTWYNSKNVDFSANPSMKYMQYIFPVMFLFALNSYSSGLTAYMFFSNILNIGMTVFTKRFLIDENKLRAKIEENKKNPNKPKSAFQQRLEQAMKEQQARQQKKN
jgi:YidC/Oxa1 family membrane protein insertase